jgi:hypothetical protein
MGAQPVFKFFRTSNAFITQKVYFSAVNASLKGLSCEMDFAFDDM